MAVAKELDYLFNFPLNADSVVVEVGCYTGEWAEEINRRYNCRVFTFEPMAQFYDEAVKRFAGNPKIGVVNYAVGAFDGIGVITAKGTMTGAFACGGEVQDCKYMGIRQALGLKGATSLLSLNCEGGEFAILEWLISNDAMAEIPHLLVQFHPVVPDCGKRYEDIQQALSKTHEATYSDGWVWQKWRRKQ